VVAALDKGAYQFFLDGKELKSIVNSASKLIFSLKLISNRFDFCSPVIAHFIRLIQFFNTNRIIIKTGFEFQIGL